MWDLLNQLYKRFGLWVFLAIALVFSVIWGVAHKNAQPCEQVSILGLIKYTKSCGGNGGGNGGNNGNICRELQQHIRNNSEEQDRLRQEISRLESAASKGDVHARRALEESHERLKALEQQGNEIKRQIDRKNC